MPRRETDDVIGRSHGRLSEQTSWARNAAAPLRDFLATETGGAVVLVAATLSALVWANSPWPRSYESVWTTMLSVRLGDWAISQDVRHWVNDGLMALFFLVVGLEANREFVMGDLRNRRRAAVPLMAALGGMGAAVGIYLALNAGGSGVQGWGTALSTDTAFALGLLAIAAPGRTRLRVGLLAVVVFDDLVALVVIAAVYASDVAVTPLVVALGLIGALPVLRYVPGHWRTRASAVLGVASWVALYEARIDPVLSGLAVGLATSAFPPRRPKLERVVEITRSFREQPTPALARQAQRGVSSAISPNERLQHRLHPWTSFVIVPLFALANAGIHIDGDLLRRAVASPITLGILLGYVIGKPVGVTVAAAIALRLRVAQPVLTGPAIAGVGVVAGIGFTVSLLIASLAFTGSQLQEAKIGVLAAALVASGGAWAAFRLIARLPASMRARQIAATIDDPVDLADEVDPARDHIRGDDDAPVTLVEYGDYECPYCGRAELVVRQLLRTFGEDLRYVWRHLPLRDVHPHAETAAEAAEAAGAQGAFWGMHERLIGHQAELRSHDLGRYAKELGLDLERFRAAVEGHVYADRVAEDVASADASGVAGTPSFFINGKRHDGAYDVATLTAAVRRARGRVNMIRRHAGAPPDLRRIG